jgi:hypothetical protein
MTTSQSDSQSNNKDMSDKNIALKPYMSRNESFIFVHKKAEKLATAIYLVTNFLSDSEPMKWNLRKKISELASSIIAYKDISDSNLYDFIQGIRTKILELVSMLEISSTAGLVSSMNCSVLKQEFSNLITVINLTIRNEKSTTVDGVISRNFFDVSEHDKSADFYSLPRSISSPNSGDKSVKDVKDISDVKPHVLIERSNRQNIILNLLKRKKELTIKDIALVIRDCSEKTIQRELSALISLGVIKKDGDRRWTKYSILTAN